MNKEERNEKKELLKDRPLQPSQSMIGYIVSLIIGVLFVILGLMVLLNGIQYKNHGVIVNAKITNIINDDTERSIYVTYTFMDQEYTNKLKYWNEELDLNQEIKIYVLKNSPNDIKTENQSYTLLTAFISLIACILIFISIRSIVLYYKEENRVYELLKKGNKIAGEVVASEMVSERSFYGKNIWEVTATVGDTVYNSSKYYINFSLNGIRGYLIDIYVDSEKSENYYLDLISLKSKGELNGK